jgi:hypothetical protein
MKAAFLITLAIGGVNCFPKLASIIHTHVERRALDSHVGPRADGGVATITNGTAPSPSTNSTDDSSIAVTILDTTGTLQLNPGIDGNMFVSLVEDASTFKDFVTGNSQFLAYQDSLTVIGDTNDTFRMLYYYPQEMSTLQVSRLRLGAWGKIPNGAQLASFIPINDGKGNDVLVTVDTSGNFFWPILCSLDKKLNKVFIAKDAAAGPGILSGNGDMSNIITGGNVTQCMPLALVAKGLNGSHTAE